MRTTITLDEDVPAKIRKRMSETQASFKDTVKEALRIGLIESREAACARAVPA